MTSDAVVVQGLVKVYDGGVRALEGIDLTVRQGEIFGLIGPNGAGKSTTIRILSTLLKPTEGKVTIMGHDVSTDEIAVRGLISYLPEDAGAYENLSGKEYLQFMAGFYGGDRNAMVERGMRIADLGGRIDSRIKEYSKGMKRRLQIGRALMTSPRVAILDEPTAGLDVMHGHYVRHEIKRAIREGGSTAIISSHNLLEVEFLCDRVGLIDKGRIIEVGTPSELKERHSAPNLEEVFLGVVGRA
jgi:ABC-2 type transport system ATP-binding protein